MGKNGSMNLRIIPLRDGSDPDSVLRTEVLAWRQCRTLEGVCHILQMTQRLA